MAENHEFPLKSWKEKSEIDQMEKMQKHSKMGQKQVTETSTKDMDSFFKTN